MYLHMRLGLSSSVAQSAYLVSCSLPRPTVVQAVACLDHCIARLGTVRGWHVSVQVQQCDPGST